MIRSEQPTNTIQKIGLLLEALATIPHPADLAELYELVPFPKPTIRRLLIQLIDVGFVNQNLETRKYSLGLRFVSLAASVLDQLEIRQIAGPVMYKLMQRIGESVYLGVRYQDSMVYVEVVEAEGSVRLITKVGSRRPVYSTASGIALLSRSPIDYVQGLFTRLLTTNPMDVSIPHLQNLINEGKETGVVACPNMTEPDFLGIAAPIVVGEEPSEGAIGVALVRSIDSKRLEITKEEVKRAATEVGEQLKSKQ